MSCATHALPPRGAEHDARRCRGATADDPEEATTLRPVVTTRKRP